MAEFAPLPAESDPPVSGIMHCLRLLAEEAESFGLARTHLAICQVMRICEAEQRPQRPGPTPGPGKRLQ